MTVISLTWITLGLLAFAAWRDLLTRTIPDLVSIAILAFGLIARGLDGFEAVSTSLLIAVGLFLVLLPLHARGMMGGADLKLMSALAAGLSPLGSYQLVSAVALLGGLLALIYLAARQVARRHVPHPASSRNALARRFLAVELWRIRKGAALPYGVAIAAGAAVVALGPSGV